MTERSPRSVPMEVINLGLCRTGTQSFCDALEKLGYGEGFHMRGIIQQKRVPIWTDAINALADNDQSRLPTAADLDRETSDYRVCADLPISLFIETLLDAYPDATLVLSTRDVEAWMNSVSTSILRAVVSPQQSNAPPDLTTFGQALQRLWDGDFEKNGRAFFHAHHQKVREEVAKRGRKILEFDVSKPEDFQRLCDWLGKQAPEGMTIFPHTDVFRTFRKAQGIGGYEKDEAAAKEWAGHMKRNGAVEATTTNS